MGYRKREYLALLDRALLFAARHTGADGRMSVNGEIDCKDSGWLVLGGAVRGIEAGWRIGEVDLIDLCRRWTLASVRVDDTRSAWTTFALLYTFYLTGGNDGTFARSFTAGERAEVERFLLQIDMHYLYEASRNYRVAAAIIDALRLRFGCIERPERPIEENIDAMLSGYLGNGFFNDDDCRGSRADRRIDAYSAEIIGLLLHFDEIFHFASCRHEQIMRICREFCRSGRYLIDADGEFAKWGRSLRGEAEVKKIFLWEFAETHHLTAQPGDGPAAASAQLDFFARYGIDETGEIVLSRVVVPEYIVVHDGSPRDSTAQNYYVKYKDYIKNVASSEIYATWPADTIRANVLAIMSFTLNRVYTEWYRNLGYDFTITSSPACASPSLPSTATGARSSAADG